MCNKVLSRETKNKKQQQRQKKIWTIRIQKRLSAIKSSIHSCQQSHRETRIFLTKLPGNGNP